MKKMNLKTRLFSSKYFIQEITRNQSGIALLMVLGVISLLTILLADFSFETKLNKIKVYNQQDKVQARLTAEAGLNIAMAKLKLYQEGRNKIEKEESIKSSFPPADLESVIITPFVYPIPAAKNLNVIQKTALDDFAKNTILRGELSVTISKISGFLNPNGLIIVKKATNQESNQEADQAATPENQEDEEEEEENDTDTNPDGTSRTSSRIDIAVEKKFIETLERLIKDKSDSDEAFHAKYANADANLLVKEIKFYVNNEKDFQDSYRPEIENKFSQKKITPKHAPMTSLDEMYLLPSWDDDLVNLIKDRMSAHDVNLISINEITIEDLKIIFPNINEVQIEEFFKYRDGDEDKKIEGKKFKNAEEFKSVVVGQLNIVSDSEYNNRIEELKKAGLTIDTAGKLYKVNSRGVFNNAVYNLVAYIDLPVKEQPVSNNTNNRNQGQNNQNQQAGGNNNSSSESVEQENPPGDNNKPKPKPLELLAPRIIEIRLE